MRNKITYRNLGALLALSAVFAPFSPVRAAESCADCHRKHSAALVMEWDRSKHAKAGIDCLACHGADKENAGSWMHHGERVSMIVTPKDCAKCHDKENEEFSRSHHALAGEILASLDNVLAEKAAGMPGNNADAVNGCLQCHGEYAGA